MLSIQDLGKSFYKKPARLLNGTLDKDAASEYNFINYKVDNRPVDNANREGSICLSEESLSWQNWSGA